MKILKKTTVVAKPAAKTNSPAAKALMKGFSESMMEAKPAAKAMMKARAEEMFKAGKDKPKKLVATATMQKGFVSIDKKTGKKTASPMSAPVAVKMKSISEKEFNMDTPKPKKKK
jgi:hypothetical protein